MKIITLRIEVDHESQIEDADENLLTLRDYLHREVVGIMDDICEAKVTSQEEDRP